MYAMLTGALPYTVEPFNITALHAKMLQNKMNPIPAHLSDSEQYTHTRTHTHVHTHTHTHPDAVFTLYHMLSLNTVASIAHKANTSHDLSETFTTSLPS